MGEHREKHTIFGPFPDYDPVDTALLFLRTNRYQLVNQTLGRASDELQVDRSLAEMPAPSEPEEPEEPSASDDAIDEPERAEVEAPPEVEAEEPVPVEEPEPPERPEEICLEAVLERGEKWAGLLSSNMSALPTIVTVSLSGNVMRVDYVVTTTGQLLSDEEREFWKREARSLEAYVKGSGELLSVASMEADRALTARRARLGSGLWVAAVVFVVVFIVGVILARV